MHSLILITHFNKVCFTFDNFYRFFLLNGHEIIKLVKLCESSQHVIPLGYDTYWWNYNKASFSLELKSFKCCLKSCTSFCCSLFVYVSCVTGSGWTTVIDSMKCAAVYRLKFRMTSVTRCTLVLGTIQRTSSKERPWPEPRQDIETMTFTRPKTQPTWVGTILSQ